jgi:hypothetical protein
MIGKVLRGQRVQGLLRYLYGPGKNEEHINPRIIAGFRSPAELEPGIRDDGRLDFGRLDGLLTQPLALLGKRNYRKPVWHLPVRTAPEDPVLTDQQWAQIAADIMAVTGLAPTGDDDAVRWIAVRHADDHIHMSRLLLASMACGPRCGTTATASAKPAVPPRPDTACDGPLRRTGRPLGGPVAGRVKRRSAAAEASHHA